MRTFLFISELGTSIGIARKAQESGNKVYFYVNNPKYAAIGDGFVDKAQIEAGLFADNLYDPIIFNQLKALNPDCVIFDFNFEASHPLKTEFEKAGIPSYGSSLLTKSIKNSPTYLGKILNLAGIQTEGAPDDSIPVTYSITYNSSKVSSTSVFFEYVRLMNDNLGPSAYMGSIGYHGDTTTFDGKVNKFISMLSESNYNGKMDFFMKVKADKLWCEGISFYLNPNTMYAFFENIHLQPAEFLYNLAMNQDCEIKFKSPWSCQISCGVPPFPYEIPASNPKEVVGLDSSVIKHLWITDMNKEGAKYVSHPLTGNIFSVSSRGEYIREAKRRAYRTLSNIGVDALMFRTDIGLDTADICKRLREWGWLNISDDELVEPFKSQPKQESELVHR